MELVHQLMTAVDKLFLHFSKTLISEKGYSAFFKAGIFLVGAAMIALSQTGTFLYDKDLSAHKTKFTVEIALGKPLDDATDCGKLEGPIKADCMMAKHELKTLSSSLDLFSRIVEGFFWFGVVLIGLAFVGYIRAPFVEQQSNNPGTPSSSQDSEQSSENP